MPESSYLNVREILTFLKGILWYCFYGNFSKKTGICFSWFLIAINSRVMTIFNVNENKFYLLWALLDQQDAKGRAALHLSP